MTQENDDLSRWEMDGGLIRPGAAEPALVAKTTPRAIRRKAAAKARPLAVLASPQPVRDKRPAVHKPEFAPRKFEIGQVVSIPGGTYDNSQSAVFTVTRWMPEDASGLGYRVRGGDNVERAVSEHQMNEVKRQ